MSPSDLEPIRLFFYGSLMDPDVLQIIARLDEPPTLLPAYIEGFEMKMWINTYPTLVAAAESGDDLPRVQGVVWETHEKKALTRLQNYETSAYETAKVKIYKKTSEGYEATDGVVFVWSGRWASNELSEGAFDLKHYQEFIKPAKFGGLIAKLNKKHEAK